MKNDSTSTIGISAKSFFSGTLLSRISGMARDVIMASIFGITPSVAAFMLAFRFSNLLRRLLGDGAMQGAFIPHFERIRQKDSKGAAAFFRNVSASLSISLIAIIAIMECLLLISLWFFHPSLENKDVIIMTALMMPGLFFICLYGLNTSFLQCERVYFIPSMAPFVFNCIWIVAVVVMRNYAVDDAMIRLSIIVVVAFAGQWLVTVPVTLLKLRKYINKEWFIQTTCFSKTMLPMIKALFLGIIGVAAAQINNGLDAIFARAASIEGPTFLWYSLRLQQLPLALFGIAITGALLPPMARAIKANEIDRYRKFLDFGLRRSMSTMFLATLAIIVTGVSAVNLIYGHGSFTVEDTIVTARCLFAYSLGLMPITCVILFSSAFYAFKNYKTPMQLTLVAVLINILLNIFFVFFLRLGTVSIAIATSISAWINALLLGFFLLKKHGTFINRKSISSIFSVFITGCIAAFVVTLSSYYCSWGTSWIDLLRLTDVILPRSFSAQSFVFLFDIIVFIIVAVTVAMIIKVRDILDLIRLFFK